MFLANRCISSRSSIAVRQTAAAQPRHSTRTTRPSRTVRLAPRAEASAGGGSGQNRSDDAVAIPMPRLRTGAAYTFILAGFLKIFLFYIPGRTVVRTGLGELTPYLQVPFGLALCLIGKVVCDLRLHERAPKLVYAIIAAVVAAFFGIAYHSYDWYETSKLAMQQYNAGARTESIRTSASSAMKQARADVERRAERDARQLALQLELDGVKPPPSLRREAGAMEGRGRMSVLDDPRLQALEAEAEAQHMPRGAASSRTVYTRVGGE